MIATSTLALLAFPAQIGAPDTLQIEPANSEFVDAADLNGDGVDDLILTSSLGPELEIRWVDVAVSSGPTAGPSAYAPLQRLDPPAGQRLLRVLALDIDADGDEDIVATVFRAAPVERRTTLVAWRNAGAGQFGAAEPLFDTTAFGNPSDTLRNVSIAAGDLDGDGSDDLLLRYELGPGFLNAGLAVLPGPLDLASTASVLFSGLDRRFSIVQFEDIDDDSDPDLLYVDPDPSMGVSWARNDGTGNLDLGFATGLTGGTVYDENGDGFSDIVSVELTTTTISIPDPFGGPPFLEEVVTGRDLFVVRGNGQGPALPRQPLISGFGGTPMDLDGDGDRDFVQLVPVDPFDLGSDQQLEVVENLGAGAYATPVTQLLEGYIDVRFLGSANVDGDPATELVCGRLGGAISVYDDDAATGGIALATRGYVRASTDMLQPPRIVDIDGDGRLDVATFGTFFEIAVGHFQTASGDFEPGRALTPRIPGSRVERAEWLDVDLDGDLDLVTRGSSLSELQVLENDGPSLFGSSQLISIAPSQAFRLLSGDVDQDGDPDLIFLDEQQERLGWVRNDQAMGFVLASTIPTGRRPSDLAVGDFNGDGRLDVVVEEQATTPTFTVVDRPTVYLATATGTFSTGVPLAEYAFGDPAARPEDLFVADLDGDGSLDAVRAGFNFGSTGSITARLEWFRGLGTGAFEPREELLVTDNLIQAMGDLDGDGIVDLLTRSRGNAEGGTASFWFRGLGAQQYGAPSRLVSDPGERLDVVPGDLDGDGDMDLVYSALNASYLRTVPFLSRGELGRETCTQPVPNSTGEVGRMRATGSAQVSDGDLTLTADRLPASTFGLFLTGTAPASTPLANSLGLLCVGGQIGRFVQPGQLQSTGAAGEVSIDVDPGALPAGGAFISPSPGSTQHFQLWHRDFDASGVPTSNLTGGLAVLMF